MSGTTSSFSCLPPILTHARCLFPLLVMCLTVLWFGASPSIPQAIDVQPALDDGTESLFSLEAPSDRAPSPEPLCSAACGSRPVIQADTAPPADQRPLFSDVSPRGPPSRLPFLPIH